MRDALAEGREPARHGLQPRARRGDAADPAPWDHIGESEPDAVQIGRAAIGSHAEQPAAHGEALERDLVIERDIVAEEEDVEPAPECGHRLERGVGAGHGHEREVRIGPLPERGLEGPRQDAAGRLALAAALVEELLRRREHGLGRGVGLGLYRQHQVARRRRRKVAMGQAGRGKELVVGGRAHEGGGPTDARAILQLLGQAHEHHRVLIERAPHLRADRHRD